MHLSYPVPLHPTSKFESVGQDAPNRCPENPQKIRFPITGRILRWDVVLFAEQLRRVVIDRSEISRMVVILLFGKLESWRPN